MNKVFFRHRWLGWMMALFLGLASWQARAQNQLAWHHDTRHLDANIESWPLKRLLQHLSVITGWEVYVEPGATLEVSAKFRDQPLIQALPLLLRSLNFAILPPAGGTQRLLVFHSSQDGAVDRVLPPPALAQDQSHLIPNELIVSLGANSSLSLDDLARQTGGKIVGRQEGLKAARLEFPDAAAAEEAREKLAQNGDVAAVDSNFYVDRPPVSEAINQPLNLPFTLKPTAVGDPNHIIVGLIDTPMQSLGGGMDAFILPSINLAGTSAGAGEKGPGHGPGMAGTILWALSSGSDPAAQSKVLIQPVDVYGKNVNTTTFDVANGVFNAVNKGATIVNLSLGSSGNSEFLQRTINSASKQGVLFFAAAGNEPVASPVYPAAYPDVIAVTAGDRNGNIASYANRGTFIDMIAPGTSLVNVQGHSYYYSGTSVSSAYAAGLAAHTVDTTGKTPAQVGVLMRRDLALPAPKKP